LWSRAGSRIAKPL